MGNGRPLSAAVFLDRDGVLNRAVVRAGRPHPPASVADLEIVPEAAAALERLKELGFTLIAVTNQPDVARGLQSRETVEAINCEIRAALPLDDLLVCFHDEEEQCPCRKPRPGLLLRGAEAHGLDLAASFMVGDRWKDIAAGQRAGVRTVFIDCDYAEERPVPAADATVRDLAEAVDWISLHIAQVGIS
jgi:D-glycero-D-manno-heptose 1,7-bisphosphate phosphatase